MSLEADAGRLEVWERLERASKGLRWDSEEDREDAVSEAWLALDAKRIGSPLLASRPHGNAIRQALQQARRGAETPASEEYDPERDGVLPDPEVAVDLLRQTGQLPSVAALGPDSYTIAQRLLLWIRANPGFPITQAELAERIDASSRSVCSALGALVAAGVVTSTKAGRVTVYAATKED
jgi:hypothetical protein